MLRCGGVVANAGEILARIVYTASRKGGVGKVHCTRSLAVACLGGGLKAAVIEADSQDSALKWSKRRKAKAPTVVGLNVRPLKALVDDLVKRGADVVIIDMPPPSTTICQEAVSLSDYTLIVTECGVDALEAIGATVEIVSAAKKPAGIVLNRVPPGSSGATMAKQLRTPLGGYGLPLCPVSPVHIIGNLHAVAQGLVAVEDEPHSPAADEFRRLWEWVAREADIPVPATTADPAPHAAAADDQDDAVKPVIKKLTVFLEKAAWKQLNGLADEKEISGQQLIEEALDDLFEKYGRPRIAASGVKAARQSVLMENRRAALQAMAGDLGAAE